MIKCIIFDFGNVLYRLDNWYFINRVAEFSSKEPSEIKELIYYPSELIYQYESGKITSEDFYYQVTQATKSSISRDNFISAFTSIFEPMDKNINLLMQLSSAYYISLLSNTNAWHFNKAIKGSRVFPFFQSQTVSFYAGSMKPGFAIYHSLMNNIPFSPEECIFIDDLVQNVEAAKKLGIRAIWYVSYNKLLVDLEEFGVFAHQTV